LAFDPVLADESERRTSPVAAFDPVDDYFRYVDGRPRADRVRTFLDARGIRLGEGHLGDGPSVRTVCGIADGKNDLIHNVADTRGVRVFPGAMTLRHALQAPGGAPRSFRPARTPGPCCHGGIGDLVDD
jgi:hypothetical protein